MRIFLIALTIAIFAYALGLVLQNPDELPVNLLFIEVPAMRLGLLLLLTLRDEVSYASSKADRRTHLARSTCF